MTFQATHRYAGGDDLVYFHVGEEVMFVRECTIAPDGDPYNDEVGVYVNDMGHEQHILYNCMEPI